MPSRTGFAVQQRLIRHQFSRSKYASKINGQAFSDRLAQLLRAALDSFNRSVASTEWECNQKAVNRRENKLLKIGVARSSRKRDHVSNIGHTGHKLDCSLQPKSKASVRNSPIFPQISIPPVLINIEILIFHSRL